MNFNYHYPGQELQLFEEAKNWKKYLASKIKPHIHGDVLEVGAGIGETTPYLIHDNTKSWLCLEPDERLFFITQKKIEERGWSHCRTRQGTIDHLSPHEKFDTILYIDVLEHIEHDKEELEKACSHLREGGHLIVLSPAFQSLYSPFDKAIGHFRRYSKKTLRAAAPEQMKEKKMFFLESTGMLLLMINRLFARKNYPSKATVAFWDRVIVPVSKFTDAISFYSLGKTIIGIWQRIPS